MRTLCVVLFLAGPAWAGAPPASTLPERAPPVCTLPPRPATDRPPPPPPDPGCNCYPECRLCEHCGPSGRDCRPAPAPVTSGPGWRLLRPGEVPTHILTPDGRLVPFQAWQPPPAGPALLPPVPTGAPAAGAFYPPRGGGVFRGPARGGSC